ncbi:unnamed protein product [Aphanomyces euteiches]
MQYYNFMDAMKALTTDDIATLQKGTVRWMASEILMDGHYSESAHLFTFGVLLSELDTEVLPYSDMRASNGGRFTNLHLKQDVTAKRLMPTFSEGYPPWSYNLGKVCHSIDPAKPPTAMQAAGKHAPF